MPFSLSEIDAYIQALSENAEALICEASLLLKHGAFARAFTLSHLAREELSKCLMLQSAGVRTLAGHPIDEKKLLKRLTDHKAKLNSEQVQNSVWMASIGMMEQAQDLLKASSALSGHRNNRKNESLYVGFKNGVVTKPSENFSKDQASGNVDLAAIALEQQKRMTDLMGKFTEREPIVMERIEPGDITIENMEELFKEMAVSMRWHYQTPE
ncbi:AbiV family abortive infection protein [Pseudomonas sp. B21-053]|uniref:AbiV family abortive infection protein n=1 Tax=Pseudomonas sp. B21-053 TaxID=2895493 RepID=UPI0022304503|nr:AbiV family abortive infection protein [Pseudomonas sp. B21-053]UZE12805.1 AbiV family abortive infection protein [Pseudomonas sp. B21-053]